MVEPTQDELLDEDGLNSVLREADDSYRHGSYIYQVFHRPIDNTYWSVTYALSTDGEEHGLRDGEYDINEVVPREIITTKYVSVK